MVVGLLLAAALVLVGTWTALRQRQALRRLADEPFVAPADRTYRERQARRRMATSGLLVIIGGLIAGYYFSGMDARMDAIPARQEADEPPAEADRRFTQFVALYWAGVMGLVFVAMCLAIVDFWATRKYWMARYKELKADHEAKLQRDLAVYRQSKLNERIPGLKPPTPPDDTAVDEPLP
ncbi:MAG: hypothetical protein RMJ56_03980 [Gemmataceae bacterium]|nr:hypothetical protein [Gemmata sp.]MDW8196748.1 hypothetical protein [Gemmataceae bacterium]